MSSALAGLSQYADSGSDLDDAPNHQTDAKIAESSVQNSTGQAPYKAEVSAAALKRPKRKLPPLEADALQQDKIGASSISSSPASLGRDTTKAVRGDWLCYCFVEVLVNPSLSKCMRECHAHLQAQLGSKYAVLDLRHDDGNSEAGESGDAKAKTDRLHISLTRPFTVRSYERDEYVKVTAAEVKRLKGSIGSFPFTFSRIAYLANDDASRHFMVLEVGSGRDKLHQLSTALSTELRRAFRAKAYYEEARFHASTACVLNPSPTSDSDAAQNLATRFNKVVTEIEANHGPQLRKCQQVWSSRIGIQVANRVAFVDL